MTSGKWSKHSQINIPGPRQTPENLLICSHGVQEPEGVLFWNDKLDFRSQEDVVLFLYFLTTFECLTRRSLNNTSIHEGKKKHFRSFFDWVLFNLAFARK